MSNETISMDRIKAIAQLVQESGKMVILTGMGMSTESGISDFRSPGGLWSHFNPHDRRADIVINEKIGDALPPVVAQVRAKLS